MLHAVYDIVGRTTFGKLRLVILAHAVGCAVDQRLADYEHRRELDLFALGTQYFGLEESERGECPASTAAVLVLHTRNSHTINGGEAETLFYAIFLYFGAIGLRH